MVVLQTFPARKGCLLVHCHFCDQSQNFSKSHWSQEPKSRAKVLISREEGGGDEPEIFSVQLMLQSQSPNRCSRARFQILQTGGGGMSPKFSELLVLQSLSPNLETGGGTGGAVHNFRCLS